MAQVSKIKCSNTKEAQYDHNLRVLFRFGNKPLWYVREHWRATHTPLQMGEGTGVRSGTRKTICSSPCLFFLYDLTQLSPKRRGLVVASMLCLFWTKLMLHSLKSLHQTLTNKNLGDTVQRERENKQNGSQQKEHIVVCIAEYNFCHFSADGC